MNRIRLASLLCITLGMLILTARFGTQRANLATPPSTFEATTLAVLARSTAQVHIDASSTITPSPMATRTPQPTKPPRPTRTPLVTVTISSTPPTSSTDQSTSDYYAQLSPALQSITRGLDTLGRLAQHPQINDAAWQSSAREASEAIRTSSATINALKPPAGTDALNADAVNAVNNCGEAMDSLDAAMKSSDGADFLAAATLTQSCAAKIQHVQEQVPQ